MKLSFGSVTSNHCEFVKEGREPRNSSFLFLRKGGRENFLIISCGQERGPERPSPVVSSSSFEGVHWGRRADLHKRKCE